MADGNPSLHRSFLVLDNRARHQPWIGGPRIRDVIGVMRFKVCFKLTGSDEDGLIGEGFHERAIADKSVLMARRGQGRGKG